MKGLQAAVAQDRGPTQSCCGGPLPWLPRPSAGIPPARRGAGPGLRAEGPAAALCQRTVCGAAPTTPRDGGVGNKAHQRKARQPAGLGTRHTVATALRVHARSLGLHSGPRAGTLPVSLRTPKHGGSRPRGSGRAAAERPLGRPRSSKEAMSLPVLSCPGDRSREPPAKREGGGAGGFLMRGGEPPCVGHCQPPTAHDSAPRRCVAGEPRAHSRKRLGQCKARPLACLDPAGTPEQTLARWSAPQVPGPLGLMASGGWGGPGAGKGGNGAAGDSSWGDNAGQGSGNPLAPTGETLTLPTSCPSPRIQVLRAREWLRPSGLVRPAGPGVLLPPRPDTDSGLGRAACGELGPAARGLQGPGVRRAEASG